MNKRLEALMDHIIGGIALVGVLAAVGALAVILGVSGKHTATAGPPKATAPVRSVNHRRVIISPRARLDQEVERALHRHFYRFEQNEYSEAWKEILGEAREEKNEKKWIEDERKSHLEGYALIVDSYLNGSGEAVATIKRMKTYEPGTCRQWHGYWRLLKWRDEWRITYAKLTAHACAK